MSTEIRNLVIKAATNNDKLREGLNEASDLVERTRSDFANGLNLDFSSALGQLRDLETAVGSIKAPALPQASVIGGGEGASPVDSMASGIEPLVGKVASQLQAAFVPLNSMAARFSAQFDQVGGAVLALSERIDEHMNFPKFEQRIGQLRTWIQKTFVEAAKDVEPPLNSIKARVIDTADAIDATVIEPRLQLTGTTSQLQSLSTNASRASKVLDSFGAIVGASLGGVGKAAQLGLGTVSTSIKGAAVAADFGLAAYLKWEKLKSFWRNLGSVAEKSFSIMANVKVPTLDFSAGKQIETVGKAANVAIGPVKNLGREIAIALGFVGIVYKGTQAFASFISEGVTGASDLNETIGMTRNVLGNASAGVEAFADDMSKRFGIVKKDTLDVAAAFGGLGKGLGNLSGKELEDFTKKYTKMAADLSSSKNISFADAGKAIQVALSGEQSDVLKQLGVISTEEVVKTESLAKGFSKVGDELTSANKLFAVGSILITKLAFAENDLEETIGGAANAFRRFQGTIKNLGTDIGSILLIPVTKMLNIFNDFASGGLLGAFDKLKPAIGSFAAGVTAGLSKVGDSFKALVPVVVDAVVPYIASGLEKAGEAVTWLGGLFETVKPIVGRLASEVAGAFGGMGSSIVANLPTLDTFKSVVISTFDNVVGAVTTVVSTLAGLPGVLDSTFGEGTTRNLVLFGVAVGGLTLAIGALGSVLGTVAGLLGTVAGVLTSVPVIVGAAVAGVLYLSGAFSSWHDVIDTLSFTWRNFGDIFGAIYTKVKGYVMQLGEFFKSLGESLWNFLKNPAGGFNWQPMVDHISDADNAIQKRFENIAKREADLRKQVAKPIEAAKIVAPVAIAIEAPKVKGPVVDSATKELADFAAKISEKVKTPLEKYQEEMDKLNKAKNAGFISQETFDRSKTQAIKDAGFGDVVKAENPIERFQTEMKRLKDGLKAGAIDPKQFDTLRDKAAKDAFGSLMKDGDDPATKFKETMDKARAALDAGAIDQKEFNRIQTDAQKDLKDGEKKDGEGQKFAAAQELGSADFFDTVVKAIGGKGQQSNLERINNSQLTEAQKAGRALDSIDRKLGKAPAQVGIA